MTPYPGGQNTRQAAQLINHFNHQHAALSMCIPHFVPGKCWPCADKRVKLLSFWPSSHLIKIIQCSIIRVGRLSMDPYPRSSKEVFLSCRTVYTKARTCNSMSLWYTRVIKQTASMAYAKIIIRTATTWKWIFIISKLTWLGAEHTEE